MIYRLPSLGALNNRITARASASTTVGLNFIQIRFQTQPRLGFLQRHAAALSGAAWARAISFDHLVGAWGTPDFAERELRNIPTGAQD